MGALRHDTSNDITIIVVDLFCGGGGVSEGFHRAKGRFGNHIAYVAAAVNHSHVAIESHAANHPETLHLTEDIWLANVDQIAEAVRQAKIRFPNAVVVLWMSAECTHYSKAKGGDSRDAKSRTLPESIFRYEEAINPDLIYVENVVEFLSWGPLVPKVVRLKSGHDFCPLIVEKGKKKVVKLTEDQQPKRLVPVLVPENKTRGRDYVKWVRNIESLGYHYQYKVLNCANYGCHTTRERYFGIFAKHGLPIRFPEPTHTNPKNLAKGAGLFSSNLQPWRPVREVLDFSDEGESIFERETPLVEATLERILAGLHKFVPKGQSAFMSKYYSGHPASKNYSLDEPAHTVTCSPHDAVVFLQSYYGNGGVSGENDPAPTVTTHDRFGLVFAHRKQFWIDRNFGQGGGKTASVDSPAGALLCIPKMNLVTARFIDRQFGKSRGASIDDPCGTLVTEPKTSLVTVRRAPFIMDTSYSNFGSSIDAPMRTVTADRHWNYLLNPQFKNAGNSVHAPSPTLIARQDKRPLQLVTATTAGKDYSEILPGDSPMTIKIKEFMQAHEISDILMRMLKILELKLITGFHENYILKGSKAQQKEMIGNAVPVGMAEAFALALDGVVCERQREAA